MLAKCGEGKVFIQRDSAIIKISSVYSISRHLASRQIHPSIQPAIHAPLSEGRLSIKGGKTSTGKCNARDANVPNTFPGNSRKNGKWRRKMSPRPHPFLSIISFFLSSQAPCPPAFRCVSRTPSRSCKIHLFGIGFGFHWAVCLVV